jgi:UDP-N-acetylmuramoylalanine--D-glutamate ligase
MGDRIVELSGRTVVIVGLGRSGVAAAALCARRGARLIATDTATEDKLADATKQLRAMGATLALGGHDAVPWDKADLVVVSPGVPAFPALKAVEASGREVIGELELASRFIHGPIALVGGTNGKSTVTSWTGEMLSEGHRKVFVGGNLGVPPAEVIDENFEAWILEISSFQAERIPTLHARCACLLNITDDHLDRYDGIEDYANAKGNMFVTMGSEDMAIVPAGDAMCARQAARGKARLVTFGPGGDVHVAGGRIVDGAHGLEFDLSSVKLLGAHNQLNACASIAMAASMGATASQIADGLSAFEGLGHRNAFAGEVAGVRFYDDSKGTNVGASVAALRGVLERKAVLIAGGRDKLGSYGPLVEALQERGRAAVLIGEAADRIAQAIGGRIPTHRASTLQEAVRLAFGLAEPGDAVLLSPACASYDMFRNYGQRGEVFCEAVRQLAADKAGRP